MYLLGAIIVFRPINEVRMIRFLLTLLLVVSCSHSGLAQQTILPEISQGLESAPPSALGFAYATGRGVR